MIYIILYNMTWHHITYHIIYHISYIVYHISHIISYHIISYHIISYHIISYIRSYIISAWFKDPVSGISQSQWPRGIRRRPAAASLLRMWFRISPEARMSLCCECCVLSGRGLCDKLITRPEESYLLRCVVVCDVETLWIRNPWPTGGCRARKRNR
jgi:hypothetical protein